MIKNRPIAAVERLDGKRIKEEETTMKCPNCHADNNHDNKVCVKCGAQLSSTPHENQGPLRCPACGSTDIEKITMQNGKVVDPNAKKGLSAIFGKKDYEVVRKCRGCNKEF